MVNPCVDTGDPTLAAFGTTRTDWVPDAGIVDMGFHCSLTSSWAFFRNDAGGTNHPGYFATAPVPGAVWVATVDNTGTGNFLAGVMGYADPLELYLPAADGFLLIDPLSPGGELFQLPPAYGYGLVTFTVPIPTETSLAGFTLSAQGAGIGGGEGTTLHNAYDLFIGE